MSQTWKIRVRGSERLPDLLDGLKMAPSAEIAVVLSDELLEVLWS